MAFRILILVFCAGAALLLAVLANHFWWSPTVPVVLGFLGVFVPSLVLLVVMEPAARLPNPDEALWIYTGLVAAVFGLALPAAWIQPEVRRVALASLPQPSSIAKVFERDEPVMRTACDLLLSNALNLSASESAAMLNVETATFCLANTAPSEHRDAMVAHLLTEWSHSLGDPTRGATGTCEYATAVDALPVAEPNRVGVLLSCALGGSSESRTCCSARLRERSSDALLAQTREAVPILVQLGRTDELLALAFEESQVVAQLAPTPTALQLQTRDFKLLALATSCDAIAADPGRNDDRRYLEWVFGEFEGCFDEPPSDLLDAAAVCDEISLPISGDLGDAICHARKTVARDKIAAAAEFRRGISFADDATAIDDGHDAERDARMSAESLGAMFQAGDAPTSADDQAHMKRMMMGQTPFQGMREEADGQTREQGQQQVRDALPKLDTSNIQKALGVSLEELEAATKDGKLSDEMQQRVNRRAGDQSQHDVTQ